jgi:hypothetical protein
MDKMDAKIAKLIAKEKEATVWEEMEKYLNLPSILPSGATNTP